MTKEIEEIVEGCKKGDQKAQEKLYKNYYKAMGSLCLRYTKNDEDAVLVLNNAFLKVFRNIKRYDPVVASFSTWIRTIVVHSCIDFIKQKKGELPLIELDSVADSLIDAEVLGKIKSEELLHMIRELPPATQAVFNLYIIEGYSHKEIAQLLHISEGTSRWHLNEGRKTLKKLIQQQDSTING